MISKEFWFSINLGNVKKNLLDLQKKAIDIGRVC